MPALAQYVCAGAGAGIRPSVPATSNCEKVPVPVPVTGTCQKWVPVLITATVPQVPVPVQVTGTFTN